MKLSKIDLDKTGYFSSLFTDYINKKESLKPFYELYPSIENFKIKIDSYKFPVEKRKVLFEGLSHQYKGVEIKSLASTNLGLLQQEKTFTVTTGHQLNIFTGPLYFIYKIVTTINLAKTLKAKYPDYNFVPIYWMASEDHDFAEINNFNLFGQKYTWPSDQKGAVGKFNTSGLTEWMKALPEKFPLFEKAYAQFSTLGDSTRYFVNELFGDKGLVVVDGDDALFKTQFKNIVKDELINCTSSAIVNKSTEKLSEAGYKTQVNAREVNLFFLADNLRERIVKEDGKYKILNSEISFTEDEILNLVEQHPEKFSPNVVLRPLYEECLLPNLAYIGGPAELSYWFQLKEMFDEYKIPYPFLLPRNFVLYINKQNYKKLGKLNLSEEDLFLQENLLKEKYLKTVDGLFDLQNEKGLLDELFKPILLKASTIDKSLEGAVLAEKQKVYKSLEEIEKKLKKAEERKQETGISQLINLKEKLFPGNKLQERTDNFLNFYLTNSEFINILCSELDPFEFKLNILSENE